MGAAFDLMCENEGLENKISNLQRKNREMKKEFVSFLKSLEENNFESQERLEEYKRLLAKYDKPKKAKK